MSEPSDDPIQQLPSWAHAHGISILPSQLERFRMFLDELEAWNRHMNLTGLSSRERILRELVLDSLIPAPLLPDEGEMLDVGSGAGFPAIPLKIYKPQLKAHLLETNGRKVNFLKQVVRLTRISNVRIFQGRIERDGELLLPDGYNVITARGLAKLSQVLRWCAPYLKEDGILLDFQGSQYRKALEESSRALKTSGLILRHTLPYTLPGMASTRHVLIFGRQDPLP